MRKRILVLPVLIVATIMVSCNSPEESVNESEQTNEFLEGSNDHLNKMQEDSLGKERLEKDRTKIDEKEVDKKSADYDPDEVKFEN